MGFLSKSSSRRRRHSGNGSGYYRKRGIGGMFGAFRSSSISSSKRRYAQGYGTPYPQNAQSRNMPAQHQQPTAAQNATGVCPQCNASIPAGSKFCLACGAQLNAGFCTQCGAPVPPNGKFCPQCGAPRP